ncbi:FHA domain-containing protein [Bremerella sp. P1]|uniref:FHA domain-containing protein n=1 Tax=Bremerella sp. P1 TaxID=3026424 RepID=UPI002367E2D6|nr:FHA domain-containing protein [Bremerella sp. P1]WDI42672.1 FHA domain-containing protein [Bremerella sp. P1]
MGNNTNEVVLPFTLKLLDSSSGHAIQTWNFSDCQRVTIGRAAENDISLADPQVSRVHVELLARDGAWALVSLGRNGTVLDGALINDEPLNDHAIFQLGPTGPSFQFSTTSESVSSLQTLNEIDPIALDFLMVDEGQLEEEVKNIADTEVFRELQERARKMKDK